VEERVSRLCKEHRQLNLVLPGSSESSLGLRLIAVSCAGDPQDEEASGSSKICSPYSIPISARKHA